MEFSEEGRKNIMRSVKSRSKLEDRVSKELWKYGIRFRKNDKKLFGKPDITIKKYKIVIFIDSCFWHLCKLHGHFPKSNPEFWKEKLLRNKKRDEVVTDYYESRGWNIKRIWEHEIQEDFDKVISDTVVFINNAKKHFLEKGRVRK
ncbi:very short patch repair endonuclease [Bacillus capparidis]|uniref:Very short patch repair endonuclease n=1 Tax=Bacillus capparidis TaxID=1840411 RepID=A0ABS4CVJ9_9BACI|nr:very short patch repair endonuclease [Bacillus capparidis]MBP1080772.1 DNA mismatch endonuclease (patch repair protein) [Bacillus capparidis]MED1094624.1 very short patch repair endonuclease [Bacillus capparidis]